MRLIAILASASLILHSSVADASVTDYLDGVRINWEYASQEYVGPGVYARVKVLSDNNLALVYSAGGNVLISKRALGTSQWSTAQIVANDPDGIYDYTNAEMIQLQDGTLIYAWNARPKSGSGARYKIMLKYSYDGGRTWVNETDLFVAGTVPKDGCWEPAMLQLPTGEIQLFFANEYQVPVRFQNISMVRSSDNGLTWSTPEVIAYRAGSRDGMPVPVYLHDDKGIAVAIEDPGLDGTFKPVIVHTSVDDNWHSGTVAGNSPSRWSALLGADRLATGIYAGAPYLVQLPSGETLLSIQSGEGRKIAGNENNALMQVYAGNDHAKDFSRRSTPFSSVPDNAKVLWNSLTVTPDNKVMAVSSISNLPEKNGVWLNTGTLMYPISAPYYDGDWKNTGESLYIAGMSQANAAIKAQWDEDNLYLHFDVRDRKITSAADGSAVWESDGVEVYIDPYKTGLDKLTTGLYKIAVNINGDVLAGKADGSVWRDWITDIVPVVTRPNIVNYVIDLALPWAEIGGKPAANDMAVHLKLHNNDGSAVFHENLSGGNPDRPSTWMRLRLGAKQASVDGVLSDGDISVKCVGSADNRRLLVACDTVGIERVSVYSCTGRLLAESGVSVPFGDLALPSYSGVAIVSVITATGIPMTKKIVI